MLYLFILKLRVRVRRCYWYGRRDWYTGGIIIKKAFRQRDYWITRVNLLGYIRPPLGEGVSKVASYFKGNDADRERTNGAGRKKVD